MLHISLQGNIFTIFTKHKPLPKDRFILKKGSKTACQKTLLQMF